MQIEGCQSISQLFQRRAQQDSDRVALKEKDLGIWQSITWQEYYQQAQNLGYQLLEWGIGRGDVISILSENNKEWLYCDMATVGIGAITSGVYPTDAPEQLLYLIRDSGSKILFVEDEEQLDKYLEIKDQVPTLEHIIVFDWEGLRHFSDQKVHKLSDVLQSGAKLVKKWADSWEQAIANSTPADPISLIYTSGTTGAPKGAMISHGNILCQIQLATQLYDFDDQDRQLSFLPLCHIAEKLFTTMIPLHSKSVIHFVEEQDTLFDNLAEVSPTVFFSVPRVWEKVYSKIVLIMKEATPTGRFFYQLAIKANSHEQQTHGSLIKRAWAKLLQAVVLRNIRIAIGMDQAKCALTGAAPISVVLLDWLKALGVPIYEVYGQTESSGLATANMGEGAKAGFIGKAMESTKIKISEEGEILIKGGHVFQGYWGQEAKTAETIIDGWLYTGDLGEMDVNGFIKITGRKKDIIITSGGKNISPSEIETQIKASPFVADAIVIGDQRKFLTCLVMIDEENVENFANRKRLPFTDFKSLCQLEEVVALIQAEITLANRKFSRVEQVKKFRLIDQRLNPEDEELTPTMKLKRQVVESKYKKFIDQMYH